MSFNILNSARSYESHTDTQSSQAGRRLRQTVRWSVKWGEGGERTDWSHLAGHHDKRSCEPVVIKHLVLRTLEGEVETNRGSGSEV